MYNLEIDESRFVRKVDSYLVGNSLGLKDFALQAKAQDYKRRISQALYPVAGDNISDKIGNTSGYLTGRKVDGEFNLFFFNGQDVLTVNPGGTVRLGLPCLTETAERLRKAGIKSAALAGELHYKRRDKSRSRVHDVIRVVRNPANWGEVSRIGTAFFDVLEIDGQNNPSNLATLKQIDEIFEGGELAHPIEWKECDSLKAVLNLYQDWVIGEGAEGLVIRSDRSGWYKVKPSHTVDAVVVGFSEGSNERRDMLHDLLVAVIREDGTFHTMSRVGGGFSEEDRRMLFHQLKEMVAPSDYREVNSDQVAYEMVKPQMVIEMKCLDMISEKSRGGQINRMVLRWENGQWEAIRRMPFVSVISPQFLRIRDEKQAVYADVPIDQIAEIVDVPQAKLRINDIDVPKSEILKREVYVKEMSGKKMLRKLLIWKTNKETTGEFPPFVVYSTDFSSGRQSPLSHDLKPAGSQEQAENHYREFAEKAFVKGWVKV
jgi:ATP dependent DNA ligase C terminal region